MNQQALTTAVEDARAKLNAALDGLTAEQMMAPGAAGEWSVKDILAHLTAWQVDLLTNLGKAERGQKPGKTDWDDAAVDAQNAKWQAEFRDRPLGRVLDDFHGVHRQVLRKIASLSDKALAAPVTWRKGWPLYDYFIEDVVTHEAEHLPELQAWRQQQTRAANGAR